jgi:hypothetical protein
MSNAGFLYADKVKLATVTASSFQPLLAPSLLKIPDLGSIWRTEEGVDDANIVADFGEQITVGATTVLALTVTASATFRVRLSTFDATGDDGDAYDSGTLSNVYDPVWRHFVHIFDAPAVGQYLRVDIAQSGATSIGAGCWLAGEFWQPGKNFALSGFVQTWDDADVVTVTRGGVEYVSEGFSRRRLAVNFESLTQTELDNQLYDIATLVKRRNPVLFVIDPESDNLPRDSIVGRLQTPPVFTYRGIGLYSWPVDIAELV